MKRDSLYFNDPVDVQTPYQKARQVWDERIGTARVQARNWRIVCLTSLSLSAFLSSGLLWQSSQNHIIPYVIEVSREGDVRAIGPAIKSYQPSDAQIAFYLERFISNFRSLSVDPVVLRNNWLSLYDFASAQSANMLSEYARDHKPFDKVGEKTVSVDVSSIVRASDTSFQVRWSEKTYDNGSVTSTLFYTAVLTVSIKQPADALTLRKNPLGIYVQSFNWSQDLTPPANTGEKK